MHLQLIPPHKLSPQNFSSHHGGAPAPPDYAYALLQHNGGTGESQPKNTLERCSGGPIDIDILPHKTKESIPGPKTISIRTGMVIPGQLQ